MRRSATNRCVPTAPTDEAFFIRSATDAIASVMADLRHRIEHMGNPRSFAQVLLADAHIDEAVGLLRTIRPAPSMPELPYRERCRPARWRGTNGARSIQFGKR